MGDRSIAMTGPALGLIDRLIHLEQPAGGDAEAIEDGLERLWTVALVKQRGHGDGAGIDHGVVRAIRPIVLQLYRVERVPARLDIDVPGHAIMPELFERDAVGEGLGDRLDREGLVAVARFENTAIRRHHTDAEMLGVGSSQLRDVGGDLAFGQRLILDVQVVDQALKFVRHRENTGARISMPGLMHVDVLCGANP